MTMLPSELLVHEIEQSQMQYVLDRMTAMRSNAGNPDVINSC